jgi:hypothetical protein
MSEPALPTPQSSAPVVLRIILAVICLLPAAIGLLTTGAITAAFVYEGFQFKSSDEIWMQIFLGVAGCLILLPAIAIGIILRFARWRRATSASLVLAIIAAGSGFLITGMLRTTVVAGDTESYVTLFFFGITGIVAGALPPFLHWWNSAD